MASLLPSPSVSLSLTKTSSFSPSSSSLFSSNSSNGVSFCLSSNSKPNLRVFSKGMKASWNHSTLVKAQLNEVAVNGSSNTAETPVSKTEGPTLEEKDVKPVDEPSPSVLASEESVSEFVKQVASLVKLVDSKDIMELQLKHLDCELIIRKKEALPQPLSPAPVVMTHSPLPSPLPPVAAPTHSAPTPPTPTPTHAPPPVAKSSKPSIPALKCPMAGTFYRNPGPGEPPFVKVGDKVQKGQVLCIIEAMKLMNEIEADQSGTVVEILVEDGKPVSVDQPLFLIES